MPKTKVTIEKEPLQDTRSRVGLGRKCSTIGGTSGGQGSRAYECHPIRASGVGPDGQCLHRGRKLLVPLWSHCQRQFSWTPWTPPGTMEGPPTRSPFRTPTDLPGTRPGGADSSPGQEGREVSPLVGVSEPDPECTRARTSLTDGRRLSRPSPRGLDLPRRDIFTGVLQAQDVRKTGVGSWTKDFVSKDPEPLTPTPMTLKCPE